MTFIFTAGSYFALVSLPVYLNTYSWNLFGPGLGRKKLTDK